MWLSVISFWQMKAYNSLSFYIVINWCEIGHRDTQLIVIERVIWIILYYFMEVGFVDSSSNIFQKNVNSMSVYALACNLSVLVNSLSQSKIKYI